MRILVSAYACNPYGGSESGVGWAAVCRIARLHDVWVLCDIHNKAGWERGVLEGIVPGNVRVRFLRERSACSANRFIAHIQSWLNYADFNRKVLDAARDWHKEVGFDLCHQVTIAAWRMPSSLWRLPIPFVWGPIGGAGYIPPAFRGMLSGQARVFEVLRDWSTARTLRSQAFRDCIRKTAVVFAANEETEELLRPHRDGRPLVRLPIVSISKEKADTFARVNVPEETDRVPLRLFAGGNMEGRKGVNLALRALAKVKAAGLPFHYTVAGGGPEIPGLLKLRASLGLESEVEFHPGFRGPDYVDALHRTDVYFLPSFRESTPVTLLEAYLAGCYPVVADTGAQGEIVRLAGGTAVAAVDMSALVQNLANAVLWCATHRGEMIESSESARGIVTRHFSGHRYDAMIEEAYATAIQGARTS